MCVKAQGPLVCEAMFLFRPVMRALVHLVILHEGIGTATKLGAVSKLQPQMFEFGSEE